MTSLMERGLNLLALSLPKGAGGKIVYRRGSNEVWIDATFGQTQFEVDDNGSNRIEHTDRDFLFSSASLILGGSLATPQKGDRITVVEESRGDGQVFEVLAPGGAQPYRLCDAQGLMIRVHTKRCKP
jgi:hypothetical protein